MAAATNPTDPSHRTSADDGALQAPPAAEGRMGQSAGGTLDRPAELRKAPWRQWTVPLTVLAELLYRDAATPYRAAKKFGLRQWVIAQVRDFLTKGAWFAADLDVERTIRFNTAYLLRRSQFVEHRRQTHQGRELDGAALAHLLGLRTGASALGFFDVWGQFLRRLAEDLVEAARDGHAGDVRWTVAEQFLDRAVAPRSRKLRRLDAEAADLARSPLAMAPVSLTAGVRRIQFVLSGLMSADPAVVAATVHSWQAERLLDGESCGLPDWAVDLSDL